MYPPREAAPRLVLLTSPSGSDVSVVGKYEVKLVWGKSNRQSLVSLIYCFLQVISFWQSTQLCFINCIMYLLYNLFINRNTALTLLTFHTFD